MKNIILTIAITVLKVVANIIYFFMKILPTKNKVVMISRQSNEETLDFKLIKEAIHKADSSINLTILTNGIKSEDLYKSGILYKIKYCFYILKIMYHLATSKICLIDGYCIPVCILKHKKSLKIIQLWHASGAVKKFGYQILDKEEGSSSKIAKLMCMHKNYDYLLAPSDATKKIFAEAFNISENKIIKYGLPRLEYICNSKYDKSEEIYKEYPKLKEKENILYIPTFRKNDKRNLVENILQTKINKEKYNLIINLHPLDKTKVPEEYLINKKYSSFDLIKIADYIITDYSVLSIEASILEKPIFLYLPDLDEYKNNRGLNIDIEKELNSFTSKNFNDIMTKIDKKDYNMEEIIAYKNKYIEINPNNTIEKLEKFISGLYKEEYR